LRSTKPPKRASQTEHPKISKQKKVSKAKQKAVSPQTKRKIVKKNQIKNVDRDDYSSSRASSGRMGSVLALLQRVKSNAKASEDKAGQKNEAEKLKVGGKPHGMKGARHPPTKNNPKLSSPPKGAAKPVPKRKNGKTMNDQAPRKTVNEKKIQRKPRDQKKQEDPTSKNAAAPGNQAEDKYKTLENMQTVVEEAEPPSDYDLHPSLKDAGSWLGSLTESFIAPWGTKKEQTQSMADFENERLGDMERPPDRIGNSKRLESAHEGDTTGVFSPVDAYELGALTDSVSFELTIDSGDDDDFGTEGEASSMWTDSMTSAYVSGTGTKNEAWGEIVKSASIIARHVGGAEARDPASYRGNKEFENALLAFKAHARRLKMGEKELYAAVRDDPSILNQSTYDSGDTLDALWSHVGERLTTTLIATLKLLRQR
jgi:hypothetical protein